MGISSTLGTALSGLRATQAGIDVVSQNIANADSIGYTKRRLDPVQQVVGDRTVGVRAGAAQRLLDRLLQRQLRLETAGASYTDVKARTLNGLDQAFGEPGGVGALDTAFNNLTQALQSLSADPSSFSTRSSTLRAAADLASRISGLSDDVQVLRTDAEASIGSAVTRANDLLGAIATVNARIVGRPADSQSAALNDERDRLVGDLSRLVDVRVSDTGNGGVSITTTGGLQLFDGSTPVRLSFDGHTRLGPDSLYSSDGTTRTVGTIKAIDANGGTVDVIAGKFIRSGEIAAYIELRDKTLVEAQTQLDELAANLAAALADRPIAGTAATAGAATGFDIDLSGLQSGNVVTLDYVGTPAGTTRRVSFVRVEDPSQLPLPNAATADATDTVFGISFAGGIGAVAAQVQAALGGGFAVTNPAGNTLRILDDGAANTTDVTGLKASVTATGLTDGTAELPLFVDSGRANAPFTGSLDGGPQVRGFAQRIIVNPAVAADISRLVVFNTSPATPAGDATRPSLILDRLTNAQRTFSSATGIGGASSPYTGSVGDFTRRIVETQGAAAENAANLDEGQKVVLASIEGRFAETSGVNIDEELANLVQLQTAYAANARVMTAAKELLDLLLRI